MGGAVEAALAELMESERSVRAQMKLRTQHRAAVVGPHFGTVKTEKTPVAETHTSRKLSVEEQLRRMGLGGGVSGELQGAEPEPVRALAPVPSAPSLGAVAPTSTQKAKLSAALATRKAQVAKAAKATSLDAMRQAEWDSDDDDVDSGAEIDEPQGACTAVTIGAGKHTKATFAPVSVTFERALNLMSDGNAAQRHAALIQLGAMRLSGEQHKLLLRPLLLRFADESERCREAAAAIFHRWQQAAEPAEVAASLPFLVPVLVERLGTEEQAEPAEEIRALLVSLTAGVLSRCRQLLRPYLPDIGAICLGCCEDKHPEVIKGTCALLRIVGEGVLQPLVQREGGKAVQPFSAKLIDALLPHLRHRHSAVRVQVLHALEELLLCGAGQSVETLVGWRLSNNVPIAEFYGKGKPRINYLADLSRDRSVSVRHRFLECLARWIEHMDGADLYEQEVRLMPYLVSSIFDDDPAVCEKARRAIEHLGEVYLQLNESDFKQKIEYDYLDEQAKDASMTIALPSPFVRRPSLGARARVRQHFRALIYPIIAELQSWTAVERLQSAKLLEMLLVYTEEHATEFAHQILPAIAKAMDGDNPLLAAQTALCARLFAQHVHPDSYMPLALAQLRPDPLNTLGQRTQYYSLMEPLLSGTREAAALCARQLLHELLAADAVCTQHTPLRLAMLHAVHAVGAVLCSGFEGDAEAFESIPEIRQLLQVLLLWHGSDPTLQQDTVRRSEAGPEVSGRSQQGVDAAVKALELDILRAAGRSTTAFELLTPHAAALRAALDHSSFNAPFAQPLLRRLLLDSGARQGAQKMPEAEAALERTPSKVQTAKLLIAEVEDLDEPVVESVLCTSCQPPSTEILATVAPAKSLATSAQACSAGPCAARAAGECSSAVGPGSCDDGNGDASNALIRPVHSLQGSAQARSAASDSDEDDEVDVLIGRLQCTEPAALNGFEDELD